MTNTVIFCLNLLLLMAVWHFGWRRSALDSCRDDLHLLRENVREHFIDHSIPLGHPAYRLLRDMLNSYLLFAPRANLIEAFWFSFVLRKDPAFAKKQAKLVHAKYNGLDPEVKQFALSVRKQAADIMVVYMLKTSVVAALLLFAAAPFFGLYQMAKDIRTVMRHLFNVKWLWEAICLVFKTGAQAIGTLLLTGHATGKGSRAAVTDIMEECSERYAFSVCPA